MNLPFSRAIRCLMHWKQPGCVLQPRPSKPKWMNLGPFCKNSWQSAKSLSHPSSSHRHRLISIGFSFMHCSHRVLLGVRTVLRRVLKTGFRNMLPLSNHSALSQLNMTIYPVQHLTMKGSQPWWSVGQRIRQSVLRYRVIWVNHVALPLTAKLDPAPTPNALTHHQHSFRLWWLGWLWFWRLCLGRKGEQTTLCDYIPLSLTHTHTHAPHTHTPHTPLAFPPMTWDTINSSYCILTILVSLLSMNKTFLSLIRKLLIEYFPCALYQGSFRCSVPSIFSLCECFVSLMGWWEFIARLANTIEKRGESNMSDDDDDFVLGSGRVVVMMMILCVGLGVEWQERQGMRGIKKCIGQWWNQ